jgi:hypothetical protein
MRPKQFGWAMYRFVCVTALVLLLLSACSPTAGPAGTSTTEAGKPAVARAANAAPNFKDIRASILRLWRSTDSGPTPLPSATVQARLEQANKDAQALIDGLKGKQVQEWQGWVTGITPSKEMGPYWVAFDMDEFYDRSAFIGFEYRAVRRIGLPDVVLTGVTEEQSRQLRSGERALVSGNITDLRPLSQDKPTGDPANGRLAVFLEKGTATAIDADVSQSTQSVDPKTAIYTLTEPVCDMLSSKCYTYELTVYGSGKALYAEYDWDSIDDAIPTTTKNFQVTEEVVRKLADDFDAAGYFAMKDDYDGYDVSDASSATTSVTTQSFRKSIFHYHGDWSAPDSLSALEKELDDIATANKP